MRVNTSETRAYSYSIQQFETHIGMTFTIFGIGLLNTGPYRQSPVVCDMCERTSPEGVPK